MQAPGAAKDGAGGGKGLSSHLLSMSFMKRKAQAEERERQEQEAIRKLHDDTHWVLQGSEIAGYTPQHSHALTINTEGCNWKMTLCFPDL